MDLNGYRMAVGLETHVELATEAKLFCGCKPAFGTAPNTACCPVCLGLPGGLPRLNKQAVLLAVKAGLALHCDISLQSAMARKNYMYPDLPKAYQISQAERPLCTNGFFELPSGKQIRIARIHLEEDAGKLVYAEDGLYMDYNRCGVPLIEIVTEPDFSSPEEVQSYLEELQILLRYLGVSDCRIQEGSMRCDVNVSVCAEGDTRLGVRTELKNMSSFADIGRAVAYEAGRQAAVKRAGGVVLQQTRRYDSAKKETVFMRRKENSQDYRYFQEPDLLPVCLTKAQLAQVQAALPELPAEKRRRYRAMGLAEQDIRQLTKYQAVAAFFEEAAQGLANPALAANFMVTRLFSAFATEAEKEAFGLPFTAKTFGALLGQVEAGRLTKNQAKTAIAGLLRGEPMEAVLQNSPPAGDTLQTVCKTVLYEQKKAVSDYKKGKINAIQALIGQVMRKTGGNANAAEAEALLRNMLQEEE